MMFEFVVYDSKEIESFQAAQVDNDVEHPICFLGEQRRHPNKNGTLESAFVLKDAGFLSLP